MSVVVVDHGYLEIMREIKAFENAYTECGIRGQNGDIAEYAYYNEYGKGVPERPFMRSAIDNNRQSINSMIDSLHGEVLERKRTARQAVARLGEYGVKLIRNSITGGNWQANAPATIRRKQRKRGGAVKPLIDSGRMIQSIEHKDYV